MLRSIKGRRGGKKNRLGDALCLNIWPVDEHLEWLVCSVNLQVLGEGIPPLLASTSGAVPAGPSGILFKCHPLRKSNSG